MRILPPRDLLAGEQALATGPRLQSRGAAGWNERLNLVPGRNLTANALALEQAHRERHLARLGRALSPGIVQGLPVARVAGGEGASDRLAIGPGRGLTGRGQDVVLLAETSLAVGDLVVVDAAHPLGRGRDPAEWPGAEGPGVLLLVPVRLEQDAETAALAATGRDGAFADPCPLDLSRIAFTDFRIYDGTVTAFHPWPEGWPRHEGDARRRNLLAAEIFAREAAAWAVGGALPWQEFGVALALVDIDAAGRVTLLDRFAVARRGGVAAFRRSLFRKSAPPVPPAAGEPPPALEPFVERGPPFLWQARLEQLVAQAGEELRTAEAAADARTRFRWLPPVGLLPKLARDAGFFPPHWPRLAVPVPVEQLELAVQGSASLAPFDLDAPGAQLVKWLVPVPQSLYEPGLLETAAVDPDFTLTVADLLARTSGARARRDALRGDGRPALRALDPVLLAPDPPDEPAEGEDATVPPEPPLPAESFASRSFALLRGLADGLAGRPELTPTQHAALAPAAAGATTLREDYGGLRPFTDDLARRTGRADDVIDLSFVRVQADIYRLRQIMLANEEATRLATSPVLAGVVREASSALAESTALQRYFLAKQTGTREAAPPAGAAPAPTAATLAESPLRFGVLDLSPPETLRAGTLATTTLGTSILGTARPIGSVATGLAGTTATLGGLGEKIVAADLGATVAGARLDLARDLLVQDPAERKASIGLKSAIVGEFKDFRTTTIADRLKQPAANEAKSSAVRSKAEVVRRLQDLGISLDGVTAPLAAAYQVPRSVLVLPFADALKLAEKVVDLARQHDIIGSDAFNQFLARRFGQATGGDTAPADALARIDLAPVTAAERQVLRAPFVEDVDRLFAEFRPAFQGRQLSLPGLPQAILAGVFDPDPPDADEAAFLSAAVAALEVTVGILRAVEGRVAALKDILGRCREALVDLETILGDWRTLLAETDRSLAERRHDLAVARSLLDEETRRIEAVNARRHEILERHVPFVAYVRPRTASPAAGRALPRRPLLPVPQDPVPLCLAAHAAAPAELTELLGVLRRVPLGWLVAARPLLERLDRPERLVALYETSIRRARFLLGAAPAEPQPLLPVATAPAVTTVQAVLGAYQRVGSQLQAIRAGIDPLLVKGLGWQALRERALRELSLEDLLESGRGDAGLVRLVSEELERLEGVAACLHHRLTGLPPAVRLAWVQELSVFDAARDLARLDRLPRFAEVPAASRRELLRFVSWLFSRIDGSVVEARGLVSDIVRVAILLAGHAPTAELVRGRLGQSFTGRVGDLVDLAVPPGKVRIGMAVRIEAAGGRIVQGVVHDLQASAARVRITRAPEPVVQLAATAQASFFPALTGAAPKPRR
ncbi:MAG TPA: hypothetical protein VFG47_13075 [Geminicoccaceae bacterium]|nr:hypothetical protein [Geminicoccaceae bacterium]